MQSEYTFYKDRMNEIGVTPENNKIQLIDPDREHPASKSFESRIFEENNNGDILINFFNLERQPITYFHSGSGKMSDHNGKQLNYQQKRFREPRGDFKYQLPKGQGTCPFVDPLLIELYEKGEPVDTIYLTEGAFKARMACLNNLPTFGLTSITHYRDRDGLHADILKFIIKCKVKNVVILWDGDCLNISHKQLIDLQDISKRPATFFSSIKKIRTLIVEGLNIDEDDTISDHINIFFFHIKPNSFPDKPKGLDDLLIEAKKHDKLDAVIQEAKKVNQRKTIYFEKFNVTSTLSIVHKHFKLHNVEFFYHFHQDIIANHQFVFKGSIHRWNENNDALELISPEWAKKIKWIGDEYYKIVEQPSADGPPRSVLVKRAKETIKDLHGKDFQQYLEYYEGFCNVPDHFNYKQVVGKFYNRYFPFKHLPIEGECSVTLNFLKHIFGEQPIEHNGKQYTSYDLGLDYLKILIERPTQILPIVIFYSPERATGKTTFFKWEKLIFGNNAVQLGNKDFRSDFNEPYCDKVLAMCEETLLDRKKDIEPIKALSTSNKILVNSKGQRQFEIDFFCKFQFNSNNIRMVYVDKNSERFWINRVPIPKEKRPNLLADMEKEIPAFLHYIKNRPLATKNESRMHFHPDLIKTATFKETVKVNEPTDARELREKIKTAFLDFGYEENLLMPLDNIKEEFFNKGFNTAWLKEILIDYLGVNILRSDSGKSIQKRGMYYRWEKAYDTKEDGTYEYQKKSQVRFNGRPFVFERTKFVTADDEFLQEE